MKYLTLLSILITVTCCCKMANPPTNTFKEPGRGGVPTLRIQGTADFRKMIAGPGMIITHNADSSIFIQVDTYYLKKYGIDSINWEPWILKYRETSKIPLISI